MRRGPMLAIAVLTVAGLLSACTDTEVLVPPPEEAAGLEVTGVGLVETRPDMLVIRLGVSAERSGATEALDALNASARALVDALRGEGVAARDIATSSLRIEPRRVEGEITSYVGSESFRVRIRDLDAAGRAIGAAADAGGDALRISGLSLEVSDPDAALAAARTRAVEDARTRAEEMADAAGIELGSPVSIEEVRSSSPRAVRLPADDDLRAAAGVAALAPQIETGTSEIEVRVLVRFEIAS